MFSQTAEASKNQQPGSVKRSAVHHGGWVQMEGLAQRIRRLACDLCPGKSLGEKGGVQAAFLRLQQLGIIQIQVNVISLDSICIKVHPDGMGALKKTASSPSGEHGVDGTPNFIWSPHLTEMG